MECASPSKHHNKSSFFTIFHNFSQLILLELWEGFEPPTVRVCNPFLWTTQASQRILVPKNKKAPNYVGAFVYQYYYLANYWQALRLHTQSSPATIVASETVLNVFNQVVVIFNTPLCIFIISNNKAILINNQLFSEIFY